ncbi:MAG: DUF3828 domain-containing protein [Pyrinomonadaceae bacterium]
MKIFGRNQYFLLILTVAATVSCGSNASNTVNVTTVNSNTSASQPAATPADGSAEVQAAAPELLIADLYKQHDAKKSPFFQKKDRALVDKFFTKPLADLIWKDSNGPLGEMGAIDFDPLYDGQDFEIKNFAVDKGEIKGDTASVVANFTNFGEKRAVFFAMKQAGSTWKIEDIKYGRQGSLLKMMKEHFASAPANLTDASVEFQGRYRVGNTSCTVKPVKMAFEIKWAKGTGAEMFFFKEGNIFESEESDGKTNRFVFDDVTYTSGTFYRGDGKTFPVTRAN